MGFALLVEQLLLSVFSSSLSCTEAEPAACGTTGIAVGNAASSQLNRS